MKLELFNGTFQWEAHCQSCNIRLHIYCLVISMLSSAFNEESLACGVRISCYLLLSPISKAEVHQGQLKAARDGRRPPRMADG